MTPAAPQLTHLALRLGSTAARLKLKGIDGGPHKRWSMWFNSTHAKNLTWVGNPRNLLETVGCPSGSRVFRCCMAVVSSCREMLG